MVSTSQWENFAIRIQFTTAVEIATTENVTMEELITAKEISADCVSYNINYMSY